ncbi:MAG: carboxymuconolactone decarboxylase family protein [Hyphomonadaceae bacterium]|nr:carboxymuconolactone decarboxylase family protein [Hyphomonadaceae bacterium]
MARIPYADPAAMDETTSRLMERLAPLNIFKMMANAPGLVRPFVDLGGAFLFDGKLAPVTRECAILRVGYLSNAGYETAQHEKIGRDLGMSDALIEAVKVGPADTSLSEEQRLTLAFVDDLVANVRAGDETFQPVLAHFGPEKTQELTLVTGYYMMVCRFLETFDVDIEDGGAGGLNLANADALSDQAG